MSDQYKKALQEPSPSEPRLGQCIGNLPCKHVIPLFPLRYGLADHPLTGDLKAGFAALGYPETKIGKHYGLRVLRANTYVYLLYTKDGQMWTQHYQVTDTGLFARIWWNEKDDSSAIPGSHATPDFPRALPYLSAPSENTSQAIHILVSDSLLPHETLWMIQHDTDEARSLRATQVKLASGLGQKHVSDANLLGEQVYEMQRDMIAFRVYPWSESRSTRPYVDVPRAMRTALLPRIDQPPLAVVVRDLTGVLSELNVLLGARINTLSAYSMEAERKLRVSTWIDQLGIQAADNERKSQIKNSYLGEAMMEGARGGAVDRERERIVQEESNARAKRLSYCRDAERLAWVAKHPARRDALAGAVSRAAEDLLAVYRAQLNQFAAIFSAHNIDDPDSYQDFRCLASNTLAGLMECAAGKQYLQKQLTKERPVGLLGAVLMGNSMVAGYVRASVNLLRQGVANPSVKALQDVLKTLPADAASRQLSVTVGALVAAKKLGSADAYWTSIYRPIMEVLDGEMIRIEKVPLAELGDRVRDQLGLKGVNGFRPTAVAGAAQTLVDVYSTTDVQADLQKLEKLPARLRFWHNVRIGLSGISTLASTVTAIGAVAALGEKDGLAFSSAVNAGGRLTGVAGSVAATTRFHYEKLRDQAKLRGDLVAHDEYAEIATRWERRALGLAATAALALAVKDIAGSISERGEAATLNVASAGVQAVAGAVNGLHFWNSLQPERIAEASRARSAAARGAAYVARLKGGHVGWILVATEITYLLLRGWHDKVVAEQKVTDWISRSVWGNGKSGAHFSRKALTEFADDVVEQRELQRLFQSPHVDTEIHLSGAMSALTVLGSVVESESARTITVALPGWQPQISWLRLTQRHRTNISHPLGREQTFDDPTKVVPVNGTGYISFQTDTLLGKTMVSYWPNGFADGDYVMTESNWL